MVALASNWRVHSASNTHHHKSPMQHPDSLFSSPYNAAINQRLTASHQDHSVKDEDNWSAVFGLLLLWWHHLPVVMVKLLWFHVRKASFLVPPFISRPSIMAGYDDQPFFSMPTMRGPNGK
jgi:hypothetical protein